MHIPSADARLLLAALQNIGQLYHAAIARAPGACLEDGEVELHPEPVRHGLATAADATGELVELLADGVVLLCGNVAGSLLPALQVHEPGEEVVVGARHLAVDVHHVE